MSYSIIWSLIINFFIFLFLKKKIFLLRFKSNLIIAIKFIGLLLLLLFINPISLTTLHYQIVYKIQTGRFVEHICFIGSSYTFSIFLASMFSGFSISFIYRYKKAKNQSPTGLAS